VYVDASALLKVYLDEPESSDAVSLVRGALEPATARIARVEVRRRLAIEFAGDELAAIREDFEHDWETLRIIEVDERVCERAADIAETTGVRSLDALHLGAAEPLLGAVPFLTYDRRQAEVARQLGWTVRGA
jgi:predicted nucleic acid-binding protein